MTNPFRYATPDTRLRHIKFAQDREQERSARLQEGEAVRLDVARQGLGREQQRRDTLQEHEAQRFDTTTQAMGRERQRKAEREARQAFTPTPTTLPQLYAEGRRPLGPGERVVAPQEPGRGLPGLGGVERIAKGGLGVLKGAVEDVAGPVSQFMRDPSEIVTEAYSAIPRALGQDRPSAAQRGFAATADLAVPPGPFESLIGPTALDRIEEEFGPNVRREVEFLTSPTGALTTALFPVGAAGGAVTGIAAGEAARQLGASEGVQMALQGLGNIVGGGVAETISRTPSAAARATRAVTEAVPEPRPRVPMGEPSMPQRIHKIHNRLARDWDLERLGPEVLGPEDVRPIAEQRVIAEFGDDPTVTLYRGIGPDERPPVYGKREGVGQYWSTELDRAAHYARGGKIYRVDVKASELANPVGTPSPVGIRATKTGDEFVLPPEIQRRATIMSGVDPEDVTRVEPPRVGPEDPHVARADPSPLPAPVRGGSPDAPEFRSIQDVALRGENPSETLMRRHDSAVGTERSLARIEVEEANALLRQAEMGQSYKGTVVARAGQTDEFDELYRYLHNSSKVESGEMVVPGRMRPSYDKVRGMTDFEQAARVDFDPNMALVEDYMYRGWKPPEGMFTGTGVRGALGRKPGFKMPRVNASYDEMRAAGFEPLFWNPAEQARFSRMMGVKYREQMKLIEDITELGLALPHDGGPMPNGWRVPRVGSAFEGKPFAKGDEVMFTRRWAVPDSLANRLENAYGVPPSLGKVEAFGKTADVMKVIDALVFIPKRAKLIGSVFQHVDFLTRSYVGAWTGFVDALSHGQPIAAVGHLAKWPKSAVDIAHATLSPGYRQNLRRLATDTAPLFKNRNLSMKMISEAGLSQRDVTILPNIDDIAREAAQGSKAKAALGQVADLERLTRQGLFQGVYPAAILTDVKNNIAPMFVRASSKATDEQLAGMIAKFANTKYSTIPASMSVVQNRAARGLLTRIFFSMGEQEGLLRAFTGALWGPNTSYWRKHWLGAYVGLMALANTIHFASTGEPLPWARYSPISKDKWGPLPLGYNRDFAAPNIPLTGRSGTEVTLDLVGQLDTAFRLLNPESYLAARESVPVRAGLNQITGRDFFGAPIDTVGPEGVFSRTSQLISDMFAPIGVGQAGLQLARDNIQAAEGIIQPGEDRLGTAGVGVQATGVNLRAETTPQLLERIRGDVMQEMGIGGRYEELDQITKPGVDAKVEERIGPELELRRETAEIRGQTTPESRFYGKVDVKRGEQQEVQLVSDAKLNSGQWAGDVWRDDLADRQREFYIRRDELKQDAKIEFEDRPAKNKIDKAINDYFDVNLDDYVQPDGTKDWDDFFGAQDAALAPLSPADKRAVMEKVVHKYDTSTVAEFRKAQEVVDEFYDKPKYEGLSVKEGESLDEFLNVTVEEFQRRAMREIGIAHDRLTAIVIAAEESGLPEKLLSVAIQLSTRQARTWLINPERDEWLIQNERILAKFYPDLLERELSRMQEAGLGKQAFEAIAAR